MKAASGRNLGLLALGALLLALLWQMPGRQAPGRGPTEGFSTPRPTPTVESHWRPLLILEASGSRNLCEQGQEVTVPGPWRIRATPIEQAVQVRVFDKRDGRLFSRVWAAGLGNGGLATLPQGNGTFCLEVEAEGDYTLWVEAWEAPQG